MTNNDDLAIKLKAAAEKATAGEWWFDVVETDGEHGDGEDRGSEFHSYAVYVDSELLLDMTNSTAACIHEEWDNEYHLAWDEVGRRNAEFIAIANPANLLALLAERDADKAENKKLRGWVADLEQKLSMANDRMILWQNDALEAKKRIAELNRDVDAANARVDTKCAQLCNQDEEIEMLRLRIAELEGRPVAPINFSESADADYCREWAWNETKKELNTEHWKAEDNGNFYGFFLTGWHARLQFNEQRRAENLQIAKDVGLCRTLTVRLSDCDYAAVQHMSGGSTDYCNGFVDGTQNAIKCVKAACAAAGIKLEVGE